MISYIREMNEADIDEIYNMFVSLYEHLNNTGFALKLNIKYLKEMLLAQQNSNFTKIFILEVDGAISGFINISAAKINSKFISENSKFIGHITELYIKDDYRGKSFADVLVNKAVEFFKTMDIKIVQVNTTVNNFKARDFYLKYGFKEDYISFIHYI